MTKKFLANFLAIGICVMSIAQTPVNMAAQPSLTYNENFSDISNWAFSVSPANGIFTAGVGAAAWRGNDTARVGTIPSAVRTQTSTLFFQTPPSGAQGYSSGIYKGTQQIELLATGTTDNTNSVAMDLFLNFSTVNAGTLSFDWASLNNSTGNRNGSLRVYASVDGISFTEITSAQVLNFTNNAPTNGSINNAILPSSFNNSSTARLRFYYHNGNGGTTGSRPRLSLDNIKITALPTVACTNPTAQPTNLVSSSITNVTAQISFTTANPAPQNYLVVRSTNAALTSNPINGTIYSVDDNLGDGTVVAITNSNTINLTGLAASTTYYIFIFSVNNACTGGPLYLVTSPLQGNLTTLSGPIQCVAPTNSPTNLTFSNISTSSITGSFTATTADEYVIIRTTNATFTGNLSNGTTYNGGQLIGNGMVVTRTSGTTFTTNGLNNGTTYYFFVFPLNRLNCNNGPVYKTTAVLTGNATTISLPTCVTPSSQPTQLQLYASNNFVSGYFTPTASADGYLVVRALTTPLTTNPSNGINYTAGTTLGNGTIVYNGNSIGFIDVGLTSSTSYHYFIFAKNSNCNGTISYNTTNPLLGNTTTTSIAVNNIYYGNLHAHSSYSDGNADNTMLTPTDNYNYAKNSLCLDFLGISDHNHATAGMQLNSWQLGLNQATAATTNNFLALYGMEWGVISNGGHVLVYGSNGLIGWETNNFNVFVPRSNYLGTPETNGTTGLFRTINAMGNNAFAMYAHPDFSDFNNIANSSYNATADSAVVGTAVASGIAFSTNTTYNDPPSSMGYIDYFNRMLSKGYRLAPSMDHDSHNTNFGRSNNNRLAVVMPALTNNNFYNAMRNRSFYATEDCDTRVQFFINNSIMGSSINGVIAPTITAQVFDPTNMAVTPTIKIMFGVPGTNVVASQLASISGNTVVYTDFNLPAGTSGYYYLDITIGTARTISAPIWYRRDFNVAASNITLTTLVKSNKTIVLNWSALAPQTIENFVIERSADGVNFSTLGTTKNRGINAFDFVDANPINGLNYYRIKVIELSGKFWYSKTAAVPLVNYTTNSLQVLPNPISNSAVLQINVLQNQSAQILVKDIYGRSVYTSNIQLEKGLQTINLNSQQWAKGSYILSVNSNQLNLVQQIIK